MKSALYWSACALTICLGGAAHASGSWERIEVPFGPREVTVGSEIKTVSPSCALPSSTGLPAERYSFHFKPGKSDKLVVYFNGGGACWNSATCVDSLGGYPPAYVPTAQVANDPTTMGGILDVGKPANPYADWSMLFVSYCTGDVHAGSNVAVYNGVPIYHRGFDNFLSAMDWLKTQHREIVPTKILAAGSSAGSYGAALNYPWVRAFYPGADKIFLLGDGGFGVFNDYEYKDTSEFATAVFGDPSVWNVPGTLHQAFDGLLYTVLTEPESLIPELYTRLATEYPKQKFAQYTTAYDAIQILFWDIMLNPNDPSAWGQGLQDRDFIGAWNGYMNGIDGDFQMSLPANYRSYIGPGCNHTILRYDDDFYTSTLDGTSFIQWLSAMTEGKAKQESNWQNLSCDSSSDCGVSNLVDEIRLCVARSMGPPPTEQ